MLEHKGHDGQNPVGNQGRKSSYRLHTEGQNPKYEGQTPIWNQEKSPSHRLSRTKPEYGIKKKVLHTGYQGQTP